MPESVLDLSVVLLPTLIGIASLYMSIKMAKNEDHRFWWWGVCAMGVLASILTYAQQGRARTSQAATQTKLEQTYIKIEALRNENLQQTAYLRGQLSALGGGLTLMRSELTPAQAASIPKIVVPPRTLRARMIDTAAGTLACIAEQSGKSPGISALYTPSESKEHESWNRYLREAYGVCAGKHGAAIIGVRDELKKRDPALDDSISDLQAGGEFGGLEALSKAALRIEEIALHMK